MQVNINPECLGCWRSRVERSVARQQVLVGGDRWRVGRVRPEARARVQWEGEGTAEAVPPHPHSVTNQMQYYALCNNVGLFGGGDD